MSKKIILSIAIIVMMILAAVLVVNRDDNQNYLIDTEKQEGNPENNFIDSFFDGGQDVQEADIENVLDKTFSALLEPLSYSYISKDYDFETGEFENLELSKEPNLLGGDLSVFVYSFLFWQVYCGYYACRYM